MAGVLRIGFLVDGLLSRYQVRLFDAIRRAARQQHAVVVGFPGSYLADTESDRPTFDGSFVYELATPTSVDGIIVANNLILSGFGSAQVQALCEHAQIPVVSVGPMPGITSVDVDNRDGLRQVIEHLVVDHGHRRLAFIRGPIGNPDSLERERVFRATLATLGVEVGNDHFVTGTFLESSGAAAVRTLLGERKFAVSDIDAIVAANDQMATGAIQELSARGLLVPDDIVVVGFDDDDHARSANPPLTTVAQPIERLGEVAVRLMLEKLAGKQVPDSTILDTIPIIRRSCGCNESRAARSRDCAASDELPARLEHLRNGSVRQIERLGLDAGITEGVDLAHRFLVGDSGNVERDQLLQLERRVLALTARGVEPVQWHDILSPLIDEVLRTAETLSPASIRWIARAQKLRSLFSELSTVVLLKEQLRTIELANSLRVIGSAVVCARHFRALGRVLDAGLSSLDVHFCCVCTFTNAEHTRAKAVAFYNPTTPRPHDQIHSAEQLWRSVPQTLPPGVAPSSIGMQSFPTAQLLPTNTGAPLSGDFLVFPLMFGDEALGYVVLDAPAEAHRAWLLEGLSGHLSSAIYEISRTEQLRIARELAEEANTAKTTFVAMMSHEVRTPLNVIMGNLDLCLRTELTKEQKRQLLRAQTSSRALRSIVDDILDYSRVEADRVDLESVPFALDEVLEQLIGSCAVDANRKGLELIFDVDTTIPGRLIGDPLRLTQVLSNLINNAVKFSSRGMIALAISPVHNELSPTLMLRFCVEDTGIGMGPDQVARIFQPFTQADSSITRRYGGAGLGLTICQRLVELMGGEIYVQSAPGVGSKFEFSVPFGVEEPRTNQTSEPAWVVLAIDNGPQRAAMARLFEGLGHEVHAAGNGNDALRILAELHARPDARRQFVFADRTLPDMDGSEFSLQARRLREEANPQVILLSPHDDEAILSGNWTSVAGEFLLTKPLLRNNIVRVMNGTKSGTPPSSPPASERNPGHSQLTGRRILVVQDSEMSRELTCDLLKLSGAEVATAVDGRRAIELATAEHFDLILMDLHLPEVDGCTASAAIRERHSASLLPIIALSASSAEEDRSRCFDAGMNDFLRAPIAAAELIETVGRWLDTNEALRLEATAASNVANAYRGNLTAAPVLEVSKALNRLSGNRALYRQLLKRFTQTHAQSYVELSQLLDQATWDKAANLVHVLVSAAGNIGASRLQNLAQGLEVALRRGDADRVQGMRQRFEAEWLSALHAATNALARQFRGSHPPQTAHLDALGGGHLEELRRLVRDHDTAALDLVELLQGMFVSAPELQLGLQRLAQSVTSYDFETAEIHLDALTSHISDLVM
jgi:signal transduction histidine kinase/DNA-binding LacI/PurR family transcriptional regulator/CheY-like chemotaxis protein